MTQRLPTAIFVARRHLLLQPGTHFSHYDIVSRLGAGGMGEVYKAWDPALKRHVALKILPQDRIATEETLRRFAREARAASALNHPNIITVYEIGHADVDNVRIDFMAMELIEGETLRSALSRSVEMTKALNYLAQIADGLAKAHAAGMLHRDLKPENIMITSDGFAKILDFGLAKTALPETDDTDAKVESQSGTITVPGSVMGTMGYMSPEQVRGSAIDHRSDIFSFGCILYEVLTRRRPFQGTSQVDTFHKIVYEPPPPIGEVNPPVSDALRRLTFKCLGKDPEKRYQSSKEIAIDLRQINRDYESRVDSPNVVRDLGSPQTTRARALWMWIAASLLMVTTAAWIWSRRAPDGPVPDRGGLESMTIERLASTSNVQEAAISRDGRYIAHVESTPNGDVLLVQQVATGSEIEAAAADGKSYGELGFSEDGEYIRYLHDGAFRQTPVLGGSGKILIDKFTYPVSFSPDGKRYVFARDGSLFVANGDGSGERRIASATDSAIYLRPAWSPRGNVIASIRSSARRIDRGNMWIDILKLGNVDRDPTATSSTILGERWYVISSITWLPDATGIAVSSTRRALIERQLYEITYPEGQTRRLTNDLFEYDGTSVTADGKVLVSRQTDRRSSIWLVPRDRPENGRRIVEGVGFIRHLAAFPNGDIAYGASSGGNPDLWRTAIDGTRRTRLTDQPGVDLMPAVSPDGRTIAFNSDRSGQVTIWTMAADGTQQRQLTFEGRDIRPRFSPDGTWLVYNSISSKQSVLHRIALLGGNPSLIPGSWTTVPAISPDGRFIAALDSERRLGVISAIDGSLVRSFDQQSAELRWTKDSKFFDPSLSAELRWTKDSQAIAFIRAGAVYLQNLAGGPPVTIVDLNPDDIVSFDWTADGQSLLLARLSSQRGLVKLKNFR